MSLTSMRRSRGRRAVPLRATGSSKCGPSGPEPRLARCARVSTADELAEAVARRSYGKLIAFLAARTRDVAGAEDALSEAFASALADWRVNGCPANPEAWLLTAA